MKYNWSTGFARSRDQAILWGLCSGLIIAPLAVGMVLGASTGRMRTSLLGAALVATFGALICVAARYVLRRTTGSTKEGGNSL